MKTGDWYKFRTIVNDGVKDIVNIVEVGRLAGIFNDINGKPLLTLQTNRFLIHKDPNQCHKMSKSEVVLWQLENA